MTYVHSWLYRQSLCSIISMEIVEQQRVDKYCMLRQLFVSYVLYSSACGASFSFFERVKIETQWRSCWVVTYKTSGIEYAFKLQPLNSSIYCTLHLAIQLPLIAIVFPVSLLTYKRSLFVQI
ncbi:hypothetical protein BD560DRAFT_494068 [Blakeslea trispora]|nr:hypothetical protein BD560DRAFT_494068 [Blakeslea trispora]